MSHPPQNFTAVVRLPANIIVCPCGRHHMVRGQRVRPQHCRKLALR